MNNVAEPKSHPVTCCTFAYAGTYGHECGAPATQVAVKYSKQTVSGYFYAGRCATCARIKGGENTDVLYMEPLNGHANSWKI